MNKPTSARPASKHAQRKRYLIATLVTCAALAMIGGSIHVVQLGAARMEEMRSKATYDVRDEHKRIQAAGEVATRIAIEGVQPVSSYTVEQAESLLTPAQWREIETTIIIPAGPFVMGSDSVQTNEQNRPQHTVELPAYKIDKYLVTNAQYARFVAATVHRPPENWSDGKIPTGKALHPVTLVSWYDAMKYAAWAGKRLPTEQEWEKAARGTDGRRWPWGNSMDAARVNTYYNVGSTSAVTAYPQGASPYGVLDMAGNVSQWVADDFLPYPDSDAQRDLFKAKAGIVSSETDRSLGVLNLVTTDALYKVMRGGSWKSDPFSTSSFHRNYSLPNYASNFYGFRCVQSVQ